MAAFNSQWSFEGMTQPSLTTIFDRMAMQLAELERKIDALGQQSIQIDHYQSQSSYTPTCYNPNWQDHLTHSWTNDQDQFYAPCISYSLPQPQEHNSTLEFLTDIIERNEMRMNNPEIFDPTMPYSSEFSYPQLPPPQTDNSKLEEILTKALERMEEGIHSQEAAIQNQEIQMDQFVNNCLPDTLPSYEEINPTEEGKEQYKADTLDNGLVFHEAVRENLKRSHLDAEEESGFDNKRSRIESEENKDEDDKAVQNNKISPVSIWQHDDSMEYIPVDLGEGKLPIMDEFKFGGGLQSCTHAGHINEKTKRRHEKTIFAIEPD